MSNTFKAFLYAVALFLAPFAEKLVPILWEDSWPSAQKFAGCALTGLIATAIGLRAFYDGSVERTKQDRKEEQETTSVAKTVTVSETKTPVEPAKPKE